MKTILVVEDFLHARHLICKKLQGKGYNTVDAATVEEAYKMLSRAAAKINLVLSDVDIPDTSGFDLLRKIKNNPTLENIPVVFLTTEYHSGKVKIAQEAGLSSFIQKPFREEKFFAEIDRAMNMKGAMINLA